MNRKEILHVIQELLVDPWPSVRLSMVIAVGFSLQPSTSLGELSIRINHVQAVAELHVLVNSCLQVASDGVVRGIVVRANALSPPERKAEVAQSECTNHS